MSRQSSVYPTLVPLLRRPVPEQLYREVRQESHSALFAVVSAPLAYQSLLPEHHAAVAAVAVAEGQEGADLVEVAVDSV